MYPVLYRFGRSDQQCGPGHESRTRLFVARDQIYTHPSMSEALNDLSAFNPQRGFGSIVYNVQICPLQIS